MSTIHWKYDILFALRVLHPLEPDFFTLQATDDGALALRNHGLLFKTYPSSAIAIAEKKVLPDGTKTVLRQLSRVQAFTFLLKAKNKAALGSLKPFNAATPSLLGQPQTLYFDNLNAALIPDQGLVNDNGVLTLRLTASAQHRAARIPERFNYAPPSGVNAVQVTPRQPGPPAAPIVFDASDKKKLPLLIALPAGVYRFTHVGAPAGEQLAIADTALLYEEAIAVIRIFKDQNTNYDAPIRYDLRFEPA
jgi:hypothetical protein